MAKPSIFVRNATGLTKELSLLDSIFYNLTITTPGFGLLLFTFFGPSLFPGINLVLAVAIIIPFLLVHAVASGQMVAAMPRSGLDYVFVSRLTRPAIGFASSFTFFFFQATLAGAFYTLLNSFISNYFTSLSLITGNSGYNNIATTLLQPTTILIVGTLLNVMIALITYFGLRSGKKTILLLESVAWIGTLLALVIIAGSNQQAFSTAWDHYFGSSVSYANATAVAQKGGLVFTGGLGTLLAATFWALFSILGYQSIGYLGGEVKRGQRNMIISMVVALLISGALLMGGTYIIENTMGSTFLSSVTFLNSAGTLSVAPYFVLAASILFPNVAVISLIYLAIWLWVIVLMTGIFFSLTRTIFAWSFDRVVPSFFSNVNRFQSPTWTVVIVGVLMEIGVILSLYTIFGTLSNLGLMFIVTIALAMATLALFPVLKPDLFKASPRLVNYKIGGVIPLVSLTGGVSCLFFLFLAYEVILNPVISGAVTIITGGSIALVALIGAVLYYVAKSVRKSRGQDLSLVFKEIPPE